MTDKRVLVTGGAGFIGSNISHVLIEKGYNVTVLDNLLTGKMENINDLMDNERFRFQNGSINDEDVLIEVMKDADYVLHQAAIPSVPRSIKDPVRSNEANVEGTLKVLNVARDSDIKKVVYASSSSVYGDTPTLPKLEEMIPNPKSPYAVSKLTGEYYASVFSEVYGLKTACLRYFNVFGPRQDPKSQYAAVMPKFIRSLFRDEAPTIYGDGEQSRDFTFVKDVVNANILAMGSEAQGVFNISRGERITINELVAMMNEIIGKNIEPVHLDDRAGDIKHSLSDISKATRELGYEPKYGLKESIMETIEWYKGRN